MLATHVGAWYDVHGSVKKSDHAWACSSQMWRASFVPTYNIGDHPNHFWTEGRPIHVIMTRPTTISDLIAQSPLSQTSRLA